MLALSLSLSCLLDCLRCVWGQGCNPPFPCVSEFGLVGLSLSLCLFCPPPSFSGRKRLSFFCAGTRGCLQTLSPEFTGDSLRVKSIGCQNLTDYHANRILHELFTQLVKRLHAGLGRAGHCLIRLPGLCSTVIVHGTITAQHTELDCVGVEGKDLSRFLWKCPTWQHLLRWLKRPRSPAKHPPLFSNIAVCCRAALMSSPATAS